MFDSLDNKNVTVISQEHFQLLHLMKTSCLQKLTTNTFDIFNATFLNETDNITTTNITADILDISVNGANIAMGR